MLSGRVPYKLCIRGYHCSDCPFDQMLDYEVQYGPKSDVQLCAAGGFMLARNYFYHPGHLWARVEYGGRVRVGLDDFAARLFGPADSFDLPAIGDNVNLDTVGCSFERAGNRARLLNPLTGVVVARNPRVMEQGAEVVNSPYGQGWLLLIEPTAMQRDLNNLISGDAASSWLEQESQHLSDFFNAGSGQRLAATGGRVLPDLYGSVPGLDWKVLAGTFLRT